MNTIDKAVKNCEAASCYMKNYSNPQAIKDFLRKIGSKGGKKSAQHPDRKRLNSEAATARWRGRIPKIKEPVT